MKSRSIVKELSEISELVKASYSEKLEGQLVELTGNYEKMNLEFEMKVSENERINKEKMELRDKVVELEQKIASLIEKVKFCEKNMEIYSQ